MCLTHLLNVWMWRLRTHCSDGAQQGRLGVGLGDHEGLFQPKRAYDSRCSSNILNIMQITSFLYFWTKGVFLASQLDFNFNFVVYLSVLKKGRKAEVFILFSLPFPTGCLFLSTSSLAVGQGFPRWRLFPRVRERGTFPQYLTVCALQWNYSSWNLKMHVCAVM